MLWQGVVHKLSLEQLHKEFVKLVWIKRLLEYLKILNSSPIKVCCDNKSVISIAYNLYLHDRTKHKHMEVDKHFIKEKIDSRMICMLYVPTTEQVVDALTNRASHDSI